MMVVWLGGLLVREAGLGSSIFPSGVRSSRGGDSVGGRVWSISSGSARII